MTKKKAKKRKRQDASKPGDPLTPAQEECLAHIVLYIYENSFPPTLRILMKRLGVSQTRISQHLDKLVQKGRIERTAKTSRGLRVVYAPAVEETEKKKRSAS